jgi:hypothetical protein
MAQHVRMHMAEAGFFAGGCDEVIHRVAGEGCAALADEQPGQSIIPAAQVLAEGTQLIAGDGVLNRERALQSLDP